MRGVYANSCVCFGHEWQRLNQGYPDSEELGSSETVLQCSVTLCSEVQSISSCLEKTHKNTFNSVWWFIKCVFT